MVQRPMVGALRNKSSRSSGISSRWQAHRAAANRYARPSPRQRSHEGEDLVGELLGHHVDGHVPLALQDLDAGVR